VKGVVFGTAGHVDHGKTSLVKALSGIDTDRWPEEKDRGLTIDIGFAALDLDREIEVGLVDVPGHEDFVKNMLAGSTGIDALLLTVAADEGPMPQTREHLMIAGLLGVTRGVVALNKIDRADVEWRSLVTETIRDELRRHLGFDDWPVVAVSAETGEGVDELRRRLRTVARDCRAREEDDLFRMPVDRSFTVPGAGTVVTGTIWSGVVSVGDTVRILPSDLRARVRSLQVHGGDRLRVGPARRCAVALVGVDPSEVPRGTVLVSGDAWHSVHRFGARVEVPDAGTRSVKHGQRVRLFAGTAEVMARALTQSREAVNPGERSWCVLDCERPLVVRARDRFILRFYSPVTTIGGGQVADLSVGRQWRSRIESWADVLDGDVSTAVRTVVSASGGRGLPETEIPIVAGVSRRDARKALHGGAGTKVGRRWYGGAVLDDARQALGAALEEAHRVNPRAVAVSLESVRSPLAARFSPEVLDAGLQELAEAGDVIREGPGIRRRGHDVVLTKAESEALSRLREAFETAGLETPAPARLAEDLSMSRDLLNDLLRLLAGSGDVVPVTPEYYVSRASLSEATRVVLSVVRSGPATPADFRASLGLSRKYLIPLLEYMDGQGVTRRTAAGRIAGDGMDA
jgi:selenocysteine-specific elongation factor